MVEWLGKVYPSDGRWEVGRWGGGEVWDGGVGRWGGGEVWGGEVERWEGGEVGRLGGGQGEGKCNASETM